VKDAIAVLEAAYSLEGDEHAWLEALGTAVSRNLDDCERVRVQTYDVRSSSVAIRTTADINVDPRTVALMRSAELPSEQEAAVASILRRPFVGFLRSAPQALARAGLTEEHVRQFGRGMDRALNALGHEDHLWVNAQDPTRLGCVFIVVRGRRERLHPRQAHRWQCIAAHAAAGFRVRRQFAPRCELHDAKAPRPDAVLRPDGKVEHAEEAARDGESREDLRAAVAALDRARGPLRRRDPEDAVEMWKAMVAGRWSLLDHFDSDGRRFVVAVRNAASVPDARGLTRRESQVLAQVALGQSNKMVAYELGLSLSTVAAHLASARAKLGLPSARALH
jgi:DNA-binding CsgD family transcriptional regulator